jgi:hypothetical protein
LDHFDPVAELPTLALIVIPLVIDSMLLGCAVADSD